MFAIYFAMWMVSAASSCFLYRCANVPALGWASLCFTWYLFIVQPQARSLRMSVFFIVVKNAWKKLDSCGARSCHLQITWFMWDNLLFGSQWDGSGCCFLYSSSIIIHSMRLKQIPTFGKMDFNDFTWTKSIFSPTWELSWLCPCVSTKYNYVS